MLHKLRQRAGEEQGFTLIELLVVMLIIGILAAIALPVFLNQQQKGQDSEAKSNARNVVSHVESCAADKGGVYTDCDTKADLDAAGISTGLDVVDAAPAAGQVQVTNSGSYFKVDAKSKSGRVFTITKSATGLSRAKTATDGTTADGTW